ncbi:polysaccharide pyruvyl transferase family protein [Pseudokineococcus basanitobsidens]|uniref:Polysaccharide pyruvyl transferase family protein n=1 Tax=Pseudokineococcus basanitobsidens TaxID=1926649 RepID=A0ABU8RP59_9ACTN
MATSTDTRRRALRERVYDVYASPRLLHPADRVVLAAARGDGGAGAHVLLCPPGAGNTGDQAMVDAFVHATSGPVALVVHDVRDVEVPAGAADRVRVVPLPGLVYGGGARHLRAVARAGRLVAGARSVSVVGADLMDGGSGHRPALHLALLATAAARRGVPTRVLGFSWSADPHPACRRALVRTGRRGVRLMARDPRSAARLREAGVPGVEEVADTVFSTADDLDPSLADELLGPRGDRPLVVVNASGLVGTRVPQLPDLRAVVEHLRRRGALVVLLPHVQRPGGDDVVEVRRLAAALAGDDGVLHVDRLVRPAQVRGLVDRADAVLTGRMHLAVMALSRGVPALCLATQGKVEGLMDLVGTPELSVRPRPGIAAELVPLLDDVLDGRLADRAALRDAADRAREASLRGLEGLG